MISRRIFCRTAVAVAAIYGSRNHRLLADEITSTVNFTQRRSTYNIPDVTLLDHDARPIPLRTLLSSKDAIVLDFFFASCSTVCPVLSAAFVYLQDHRPEKRNVTLVSIAIDPEHDTPEVLRDYRARHHAREGWTLLTGTKEDIVAVMKAFDAYVENKMSHRPLNFLWEPKSQDWLRVEGPLSGKELVTLVESIPHD